MSGSINPEKEEPQEEELSKLVLALNALLLLCNYWILD
jgi:hypothetical protein